jgi:hypothetical protein
MPDITDLILDEHDLLRRRFAELDERRSADAGGDQLERLWRPVADLLERHATAEEQTFYPRLLKRGENAEDETEDAISDHNKIREAVRRAEQAPVGTDDWWAAVLDARASNSDHMAEEEREALPDFRGSVDLETREELGSRWLAFCREHPGAEALDLDGPDVQEYIRRHS